MSAADDRDEEAGPLDDLRARFESVLKEFDALSCAIDPEEEPYKSKYKARKILVRWIARPLLVAP